MIKTLQKVGPWWPVCRATARRRQNPESWACACPEQTKFEQ